MVFRVPLSGDGCRKPSPGADAGLGPAGFHPHASILTPPAVGLRAPLASWTRSGEL